jgi:prepilin-type processing-associated H-X9-DG protein
MSYITSIGIANPKHCFTQQSIANFMIRTLKLNGGEGKKLQALYRSTGIETRYSVLSDFGQDNNSNFFKTNGQSSPLPSTKQRLELYKKHSLELSLASIRQCFERISSLRRSEITHLIVVSCTGMYAPGLDIDLVKELDLNKTISRTCINFMGCYASFNALRLANTFCAVEKNAKALIVCTELCSIHFQKENTEDNMLANALFADGSAAVLVEAEPRTGLNLKPIAFHCDLATEGEKDMAWTIGDWGFEMKLSTYVPDVIRNGIKKFTKSLLERMSIELETVSLVAIHPGGKKILEVIEQQLKLGKNSNRFAYEVLRKYGNMSSPTVLFVLNEICKTLARSDHNKTILSFAFGPGLTLESALLEIEYL